jgi:predicted HTH transcriptional regulator
MGRYYSGDIEGKFWFAVQSSDAADRFGVYGQTPNYLEYYFGEESLETVQNELKEIEEKYKDVFIKIEKFFEEKNSYSDEELASYLGVSKEEVREILSEYADYNLGKKIEKSIIENGRCDFQAEL